MSTVAVMPEPISTADRAKAYREAPNRATINGKYFEAWNYWAKTAPQGAILILGQATPKRYHRYRDPIYMELSGIGSRVRYALNTPGAQWLVTNMTVCWRRAG